MVSNSMDFAGAAIAVKDELQQLPRAASPNLSKAKLRKQGRASPDVQLPPLDGSKHKTRNLRPKSLISAAVGSKNKQNVSATIN